MHPLLRAAGERRLGLFTAAEAHHAGYGRPEIRSLLRSGRWVRLRRGIYTTAANLARHEREGRRHQIDCLAVLIALDRPTAALSHRTAARLWGLPGRWSQAANIRLIDPAHGRAGQGFSVTRAPLDPAEVSVRGPFRLTTVARTLVDVAREEPLEAAVVAMDAALLTERVTRPQLADGLARARHWRGGPGAARAVELSDGRAESPLETRGRLRIVGAGLPAPELQVEIRAFGRLVGVVDAWFEEAAVAVEFDGRVKYSDPWRNRSPERVLWEEKLREDELRALDIRVVRVVDGDLDGGWPRVEGRLGGLLAVPGPAVRRFTATPRVRGIARAG
ncbi:DUF559 domain-containing protein [Blastococcus jejuensis]|uniref:DUF559 domain-containing protein n=1 Tax=Blastococcus jejuensis TaxID=351224 RepID=A0ABP6NTF2_9ACTN